MGCPLGVSTSLGDGHGRQIATLGEFECYRVAQRGGAMQIIDVRANVATAIKIVDGEVEFVTEGEWRLFKP